MYRDNIGPQIKPSVQYNVIYHRVWLLDQQIE